MNSPARCTPARGYHLLQLTSGWRGGEGGEWRGLHLGKPFEEGKGDEGEGEGARAEGAVRAPQAMKILSFALRSN